MTAKKQVEPEVVETAGELAVKAAISRLFDDDLDKDASRSDIERADFALAAKAALAAGVPGNELRQLVVQAYDEIDGVNKLALEHDVEQPFPLVRL